MQTKNPNNQTDPLEISLVDELNAITHLIYSLKEKKSKSSLALVRILEDMPKSQWDKIKANNSLDQWLGIPLDGDMDNAVKSLSKDVENLLFQRDHDPLTGIGNRRLFDATLEREFAREQRSSSDLSLILFDIDNFKKINDTYGHYAGDLVLKKLSQILSKTARPYDTPARIGGEEFVLLLPAVSCMTATVIARRILNTFSKEVFVFEGESFKVTFSAGVSSIKDLAPPITTQRLLQTADKLLYMAKKAGKNRICSTIIDMPAQGRCSLVQAAEKQLLFGQ